MSKVEVVFFFFFGGGGGLYVYTVYGTYMYIYLQYTVLFFGLGIDEIQFESMLGILAQVFIRWDGMFLWIAQWHSKKHRWTRVLHYIYMLSTPFFHCSCVFLQIILWGLNFWASTCLYTCHIWTLHLHTCTPRPSKTWQHNNTTITTINNPQPTKTYQHAYTHIPQHTPRPHKKPNSIPISLFPIDIHPLHQPPENPCVFRGL